MDHAINYRDQSTINRPLGSSLSGRWSLQPDPIAMFGENRLGREWGVGLHDHTGSYESAGAQESDLSERTASLKNQRFAHVPHHGLRCGLCFEARE